VTLSSERTDDNLSEPRSCLASRNDPRARCCIRHDRPIAADELTCNALVGTHWHYGSNNRSLRRRLPSGPRSSVWRVWTHTPDGVSRGDVYVAARTVADRLKVSLHGSGIWRYAYTAAAAKVKGYTDGTRPPLHRWQRPQPNADGSTLAFRVHVAPADLRLMRRTKELDRPIHWCSPPADDSAAQFSILLTPAPANLPGLIWQAPVGPADHVALVYDVIPLSSWYRDEFPAIRRTHVEGMRVNPEAIDDDLRLILFGIAPDGSRFFLDAAVAAPTAAWHLFADGGAPRAPFGRSRPRPDVVDGSRRSRSARCGARRCKMCRYAASRDCARRAAADHDRSIRAGWR
jgi:hypothetical protein